MFQKYIKEKKVTVISIIYIYINIKERIIWVSKIRKTKIIMLDNCIIPIT